MEYCSKTHYYALSHVHNWVSKFDGGGNGAFMTLETLANRCGMKRRALQRALSVLEEQGFIAAERTPGRPTNYRIISHQPSTLGEWDGGDQLGAGAGPSTPNDLPPSTPNDLPPSTPNDLPPSAPNDTPATRRPRALGDTPPSTPNDTPPSTPNDLPPSTPNDTHKESVLKESSFKESFLTRERPKTPCYPPVEATVATAMPSASPLPGIPKEKPPVSPPLPLSLEPEPASSSNPGLAGNGAGGLAAPSRAEASPAADTGTATPVEKQAKTRKPAEERIKAITAEMLPDALKPFHAEFAEFWSTKGGKRTPRALTGQISQLDKILVAGGSTALRSQFAAAKDAADLDDPFDAITYANWDRYGRNKPQASAGFESFAERDERIRRTCLPVETIKLPPSKPQTPLLDFIKRTKEEAEGKAAEPAYEPREGALPVDLGWLGIDNEKEPL